MYDDQVMKKVIFAYMSWDEISNICPYFTTPENLKQ